MEKYFDDPSTITVEEIKAAIRKATLAMEVNPMICGSSFKNKGVQTLLDAVCAYLPSPEDSGVVEGHAVGDPDEVLTREPSPEAPMCALAFKIATDPYVGRLCFFRVYSGEIQAGSYVLNSRSGKKERISRLFQMHPTSRTRKRLLVVVISAQALASRISAPATLSATRMLRSCLSQWSSPIPLSVSL